MTQDEKNVFTRRITQANRTGLIVVLYDIFLQDLQEAEAAAKACRSGQEAEEAYSSGQRTAETAGSCSTAGNRAQAAEEASERVHAAALVLSHLKADLDMRYPVAKDLFSLYDWADRALTEGLVKMDAEIMHRAYPVISALREAFSTIASADDSGPLMQHTEKLAAGLTYGRHDLNETVENYDASRGFLA